MNALSSPDEVAWTGSLESKLVAEDNFEAVDPLAQVSKEGALALFDDEPDILPQDTDDVAGAGLDGVGTGLDTGLEPGIDDKSDDRRFDESDDVFETDP